MDTSTKEPPHLRLREYCRRRGGKMVRSRCSGSHAMMLCIWEGFRKRKGEGEMM